LHLEGVLGNEYRGVGGPSPHRLVHPNICYPPTTYASTSWLLLCFAILVPRPLSKEKGERRAQHCSQIYVSSHSCTSWLTAPYGCCGERSPFYTMWHIPGPKRPTASGPVQQKENLFEGPIYNNSILNCAQTIAMSHLKRQIVCWRLVTGDHWWRVKHEKHASCVR
jgi:hypothetical protein